ncbi:Eukaryotic translation initiation factor 2A [Amphibalanus amphitrite]|uniref:Eukaryotic translation initiation factor 2A n=2 Tax=Amphibalanus amphitrite TaxID=1232801 RepID=A0A6A4WXL6_AMPAM|nr:eukaryotic translation initiation factor 2A-like isoform X1 [Amphibalanus amphitrite]XP_043215635.1 eukaryotic translation initiation factor 2A-like isoform X1 [Amphibalanus amphitrite]KAF0307178.1 Eukaryotic translation initiation factor 2A [Amphibalanus amphitrite]
MANLPTPVFIARGSPGLYFAKGPKCQPFSGTPDENFSDVRGLEFSSDGSRIAWVTSQCVKVAETTNWEVIMEANIAKVGAVKFSPTGKYLGIWHPFFVSKENPQGGTNMYVYDVDKKECIKSLIHKKYQSWEIQWSPDDAICGRSVSNEVHFFENGQLDSVVHKLRLEGLSEYSLAPSSRNPHVAAFIPSVGGRPAGARMFKYPNFSEDAAVGRKSFFNANSVEMKWNSRGNTCLLLTSTDVDKTGQSYYGETSIYCLDTKGATAHLQPGGKKGPVYAFEWSPLGTEFCLVYGFMPAKATLYNMKADPVFEFEPAHRNAVFYNPQGNLLALAGFGNLRGKIEVWDMEARKQVAAGDCPDTTELRWCPDGRHFTVATCAPRLRQGNGFRVWHYTLQMIYEKNMAEKHELYETYWQPFPSGTFPKPVVGSEKVKGTKPSQPPPAKTAYVPPNMRGLSKTGQPERKKVLPPGMSEPEPEKKTKSKNKKKGGGDGPAKPESAPAAEDEPFVPPSAAERTPAPAPAQSGQAAANVDRKKKRENLKKKLKDIAKLKSDQAAGKEMNQEQLDKISREADLTRELQELTV